MAQSVEPKKLALKQWSEFIKESDPVSDFLISWMRLKDFVSADLSLIPSYELRNGGLYFIELEIKNFNTTIGKAAVILKCSNQQNNLEFSSLVFSEPTTDDIRNLILQSLYQFSPANSLLQIVLNDDVYSDNSTLAIVERYTNSGWILDPAKTFLVSENPRLWIFNFIK